MSNHEMVSIIQICQTFSRACHIMVGSIARAVAPVAMASQAAVRNVVQNAQYAQTILQNAQQTVVCHPTSVLQTTLPTNASLDQMKLLALQQAHPFSVRKHKVHTTTQLLQAIQNAPTKEEFNQRHADLTRFLKKENTLCLQKALCTSTLQATKAAGFKHVQSLTLTPQTTAIIGQDDQGRSLISELTISAETLPVLQSEIMGFQDPTCAAIMDTFQLELTKTGAKLKLPGKRKTTGGVATLATSKQHQQAKTKAKRRVLSPKAQKIRVKA